MSTALAGGVDRAGRVTANDARVLAAAKRYQLNVVDLTAVDDGQGNHHSKYSKSAPVIEAIGRKLEKGSGGDTGTSGVVTAVTDVGNSLLKVPAALVGGSSQ